MSLNCLFGHQWNDSCKCERCGATRDERHNWSIVEGKCVDKCFICGKERSVEHKWNGCKCERCGVTRDERHNWSIIEGKCIEKCSVCGKERSIEHKSKLSMILNPSEIEKVRVILDLCFHHHGNPEVAASGGEILGKVALDADLTKQDIARMGAMCGMIIESSNNYSDRIDIGKIMMKLNSTMGAM